jgi:hypothetical protein
MEGDHLKDLDIQGRILLKWIFKKLDGGYTGFICLRIGPGAGCYECLINSCQGRHTQLF